MFCITVHSIPLAKFDLNICQYPNVRFMLVLRLPQVGFVLIYSISRFGCCLLVVSLYV